MPSEQDDAGTDRWPVSPPDGHAVEADLVGAAEVVQVEDGGYTDWHVIDLAPDGKWVCECGDRLSGASEIADHWSEVRDAE